MGLVKVALGEQGRRLAALAARDYFFDTPREARLLRELHEPHPDGAPGLAQGEPQAAAEALRRGYNLLIFPEGTRSRDGELQPFFPTAGLPRAAVQRGRAAGVPAGTLRRAPARHARCRATADLEVRFGQAIPVAELARAGSRPRAERGLQGRDRR